MRRRNFIALLGGAIAWPFVAHAQQSGKVYRIAIVVPAAPVAHLTKSGPLEAYRVFFEELERQGFVEGQNLIVERYSGEGKSERYADLAREVVRTKPDLIVANANRMATNFKAATTTIPIVALTADPVAAGLVTNLARPGGNLTGASIDAGMAIWGKRLQFLKEAVPTASRIALLVPQRVWEGTDLPWYVSAIRETASAQGVALIGAPVDNPHGEEQFRRAFATLAEKNVDAFLVGDAPENFTNRHIIGELVAKSRLPAMYPYREHVEIGGLMAYVADFLEVRRHMAVQISQILKGGNAGEIPFYQASKFDLVLNLKAAKELGLTFSPSLLVFASEVIE